MESVSPNAQFDRPPEHRFLGRRTSILQADLRSMRNKATCNLYGFRNYQLQQSYG